jgi:hypothetical protein
MVRRVVCDPVRTPDRVTLPETPLRLLLLGTAAAMAAFVLLGARQVGQVGWFPGPVYDKLVHGTYYGVMAVLLDRGLARHRPVLAIALAIAVGAADELHQLDVPLRDASAFDWLADIAGVLLATTLWRWGRAARRAR